MDEIKKADYLSSKLSVDVLLRGALSLEQGESEKAFQLLKKGLEKLIAQKTVNNRVAQEFKRLKQSLIENKNPADAGEGAKMKLEIDLKDAHAKQNFEWFCRFYEATEVKYLCSNEEDDEIYYDLIQLRDENGFVYENGNVIPVPVFLRILGLKLEAKTQVISYLAKTFEVIKGERKEQSFGSSYTDCSCECPHGFFRIENDENKETTHFFRRSLCLVECQSPKERNFITDTGKGECYCRYGRITRPEHQAQFFDIERDDLYRDAVDSQVIMDIGKKYYFDLLNDGMTITYNYGETGREVFFFGEIKMVPQKVWDILDEEKINQKFEILDHSIRLEKKEGNVICFKG